MRSFSDRILEYRTGGAGIHGTPSDPTIPHVDHYDKKKRERKRTNKSKEKKKRQRKKKKKLNLPLRGMRRPAVKGPR